MVTEGMGENQDPMGHEEYSDTVHHRGQYRVLQDAQTHPLGWHYEMSTMV